MRRLVALGPLLLCGAAPRRGSRIGSVTAMAAVHQPSRPSPFASSFTVASSNRIDKASPVAVTEIRLLLDSRGTR